MRALLRYFCRSVSFGLLSSSLLAPALAAGASDVKKETFDDSGKKHQYFVFVPGTISNTPAPMLVLLHGSGRDGRSILDPWKKLAEREGLVLVAPNAVDSAGWQNPLDGPEVLMGIADEAAKRNPVDKKRIYLFGHSAGAVFALLMPLWQPDYFAAVAVHAGAITAGSEGLANNAARAAWRKTPVQIQVGTNDPFFPLKAVQKTRDIFMTNGFTVDYREIPRHDHNYYAVSEQVNQYAWNFLSGRILEGK